MAGLPPDSEWVMQQHNGIVTLSNAHSGEELLRFDPSNSNQCVTVQMDIYMLTQLSDEQKSFAHFWSGYFYAHATR